MRDLSIATYLKYSRHLVAIRLGDVYSNALCIDNSEVMAAQALVVICHLGNFHPLLTIISLVKQGVVLTVSG